MTALAILHRDAILAEIASGKRLSDIAPKYGVCPEAISKPLRNDPDYRAAIESSFEQRLDAAENQIQAASEQVDVSRARAYHDALKWRAGVECSHRWGQRTHVEVDIGPRLADRLQRAEERAHGRLIEVESGESEIERTLHNNDSAQRDDDSATKWEKPALEAARDDAQPADRPDGTLGNPGR